MNDENYQYWLLLGGCPFTKKWQLYAFIMGIIALIALLIYNYGL